MPPSAEQGPGRPACREGSAGIQPICFSSVFPLHPQPGAPQSFQFPRQEGEEAARSFPPPPAALFPPPVEEQREAGKQSSGSRWASPAACQPSRLPAPSLPSCRTARALPFFPNPAPHPGRAAHGSPASRPGASGKVLRGDLLLTDPPQQQQRSAARGSGSLISFFFFFFLLLSPFGLYSPSSLCRQLLPPSPPRQAAEIKHLRALTLFSWLNAAHLGSTVPRALCPARGQSGAWLSGKY